jgi:hypothetical protein
MPVLNKAEHERLLHELRERVSVLFSKFESRPLNSNTEGCPKGRWMNPDNLCATVGRESELRMAVSDFKAILAEIGRLK